MLSFVIFAPLAGVLAIALLPKERNDQAKWIAAGISAIVLVAVHLSVRRLRP